MWLKETLLSKESKENKEKNKMKNLENLKKYFLEPKNIVDDEIEEENNKKIETDIKEKINKKIESLNKKIENEYKDKKSDKYKKLIYMEMQEIEKIIKINF